MSTKKTVKKVVSTSTIADKRATEESASTESRVRNLTVDTIVADAAALSVSVQRRINEISMDASKKLNELRDIEAATKTKKEELAEMLGQEAAACDVEEFQRICEQRKLDAEHARDEHILGCQEAQVQATKQAEEHRRTLEDARKREMDTYQYNLDKARRQEADAYAKTLEDTKRAEQLRHAELLREWAAKDAEYTAKDTAHKAALDEAAAKLNEVLKAAAIEKAAAVSAVRKDCDHAAALLAAQNATSAELAKAKIAALEERIVSLTAQNAALAEAAKDSLAKLDHIATKAVEGASGQQALTEVRAVLRDQQASATSKTK